MRSGISISTQLAESLEDFIFKLDDIDFEIEYLAKKEQQIPLKLNMLTQESQKKIDDAIAQLEKLKVEGALSKKIEKAELKLKSIKTKSSEKRDAILLQLENIKQRRKDLIASVSDHEQTQMKAIYDHIHSKSQFNNHQAFNQVGLSLMANFVFKYSKFLYFYNLYDLHQAVMKNYLNKVRAPLDGKMHYPHALQFETEFEMPKEGIIKNLNKALDLAEKYYQFCTSVTFKGEKDEFSQFKENAEQLMYELNEIHFNSKRSILNPDRLPPLRARSAASMADSKDSKDAKNDITKMTESENEKSQLKINERRKKGNLVPDLSTLNSNLQNTWLKRKVLAFHTNLQLKKMIDAKEISEHSKLSPQSMSRARLNALKDLDKSTGKLFGNLLCQLSSQIEVIVKQEQILIESCAALEAQIEDCYSDETSDLLKVKQSEINMKINERQALRKQYAKIMEEDILSQISEKDLQTKAQKFEESLRTADNITPQMIQSVTELTEQELQVKAQRFDESLRSVNEASLAAAPSLPSLIPAAAITLPSLAPAPAITLPSLAPANGLGLTKDVTLADESILSAPSQLRALHCSLTDENDSSPVPMDEAEDKGQKDKKRKPDTDFPESKTNDLATKPKNKKQKQGPGDESKTEQSAFQFAIKSPPLKGFAKVVNEGISRQEKFVEFIKDIMVGNEVSFTLILNQWQNILLTTSLQNETLELLGQESITKTMGYGLTPILAAAMSTKARKQTIDELINSGANVNTVVNSKHNPLDGCTALMVACYFGNRTMIDALLSARVNPNLAVEKSKTYQNWTALEFACAGGHLEVVKLLLDRNCPCTAKGSEDQYLWEIALDDVPIGKAQAIRSLITSHQHFVASSITAKQIEAAKSVPMEDTDELKVVPPPSPVAKLALGIQSQGGIFGASLRSQASVPTYQRQITQNSDDSLRFN